MSPFLNGVSYWTIRLCDDENVFIRLIRRCFTYLMAAVTVLQTVIETTAVCVPDRSRLRHGETAAEGRQVRTGLHDWLLVLLVYWSNSS